mmetsp:Transcript_61965/g.110163  ORF Transcript_61965/g.110163 Transcript_61965/m.110163 type:complete len:1294 (+) Transcript_61965:52-3933(+)|eukprot:CAMPEP_0197629380 /NCGR_PEP_ID=MMETSP1338-20131121/7253_1 /TAXON_ID=43686 ORGANISM="Pelagodinium beii, Strain RCC1491" /NCGR_SAMPLE_ID=MMETSP1338 /ASSEMBLY_ACC=CAM_ASM_000754 /LENGTH=1293 /DNA_ID=CAMNT_0043200417 /DNA_START=22 /DNA_END=3903 /DNA_ORIENTATION=+
MAGVTVIRFGDFSCGPLYRGWGEAHLVLRQLEPSPPKPSWQKDHRRRRTGVLEAGAAMLASVSWMFFRRCEFARQAAFVRRSDRRASASTPQVALQAITGGNVLALVDGHACLYQSFHALRNQNTYLCNSRGEPTGAVMSFIKQIENMRYQLQPSHLAVMMDEPGGDTERRKVLPGYKQGRSCPDELRAQFSKAREACDAIGVPWRSSRGYEADDLIATYALEARKDSLVKIASPDKDLLQLVDDQVNLVEVSGHSCTTTDARSVREVWGIEPHQMTDLLALIGDAADEIPGVPKVGKKKGADLLRKFGTLDNIVQAVQEESPQMPAGIGPAILRELRRYGPRALDFRDKVVTLKHVPDLDATSFREDFRVLPRDEEWLSRVGPFCEKEEFRQLMKGWETSVRSNQGTLEETDGLQMSSGGSSSSQMRPRFHTFRREQKKASVVSGGDDGPSTPPFHRHRPSSVPVPPVPEEIGGVFKVSNAGDAEHVLSILREHRNKGVVFAISSEADEEAPGETTLETRPACISIYGGQTVDFGKGCHRVWVDLLGLKGDWAHAAEILAVLDDFFAEESFQKVYHVFSDTRRRVAHLKAAAGQGLAQDHRGFAGDTMHLARLWDPALDYFCKGKVSAYSLPWLAENFLGPEWRLEPPHASPTGKRSRGPVMATNLQLDPELRQQWIEYSSACAAAISFLHRELEARLRLQSWTCQVPAEAVSGHGRSLDTKTDEPEESMWEFYLQYWQPFGELLSDMELHGMPVDKATLEKLIEDATKDRDKQGKEFCDWAIARVEKEYGPVAAKESNLSAMNLNSGHQLRQLLFAAKGTDPQEFVWNAPVNEEEDINTAELLEAEKAISEHRSSASSQKLRAERKEELEKLKGTELKEECRRLGLRVSGTKAVLVERLLNPEAEAEAKPKTKPKVKVLIPGLGLPPLTGFKTPTGELQVSMQILTRFIKDRAEDLGPDGVEAVSKLIKRNEIEARISGSMQPLLKCIHNEGRVHSRLNLNTETGRLSTRQPNLQGEPNGGLYPVRTAFMAPKGKVVLVADYAQLELRLVAHLANCPAMVDVLSSGGDIHSRTAYKMFEEVQEAVDSGKVWLDEAAAGDHETPKPLVKEQFSELRKRAKTLNFSLLYGKTAYTLAREWDIEQDEAHKFISKWFSAFPEIRKWKAKMERSAEVKGARTLMGRSRLLRNLTSSSMKEKGTAQRGASNTPVQGSAADVVIAAMLRVRENSVIRSAGFEIVMQIHDELFLEGPEESAEVALAELVKVMEDPLPFKLKVPLSVDARKAQDWHEAKA